MVLLGYDMTDTGCCAVAVYVSGVFFFLVVCIAPRGDIARDLFVAEYFPAKQ